MKLVVQKNKCPSRLGEKGHTGILNKPTKGSFELSLVGIEYFRA